MFPKRLKSSAQASDFLPYGRQVIEADDIAAVTEVLTSPYLTTGPKVAEFESAFASYVEAKDAVVVANGTAALHLAALALEIGLGDQVIVPAITFVATANAVRYCGGDVIFADVDPDTGLMRPGNLEEAIARADKTRLKALFNVHLGGQTEDLAAIHEVARHHGLKVLDDACHAVGTSFLDSNADPHKVGSNALSDLTVFSFHPVKTIAMGEGGAITTNDPVLATKLRELRGHGITHDESRFINTTISFEGSERNPWAYEQHELGFNYRATDIQCALGLSQLAKADRFAKTRRDLIAAYDEMLAPLAPTIQPVVRHRPAVTGWHLSTVLIDFAALNMKRHEVMAALRTQGIGTQVHYIPVPHQPYYQGLYGVQELDGADAYYNACLSLPLAADMTRADVARVVEALKGLTEKF